MTSSRFTDDDLSRMLRTRADRVAVTQAIQEEMVAAVVRERQRTAPALRGPSSAGVLLVAAALIAVAALAGSLATASGPMVRDRTSASPAMSQPASGRIVCGNRDGAWEFPFASPVPVSTSVLGCSRDGTRLLIQKDKGNLFVVHADGSETQVTDQLADIAHLPGSSRPSGATISPDGSRIVFAGLTKWEAGRSCHDGALFAVDADGGPTELLFVSQVPQNGIVREPTFSPDGTRIAFADGYCDSDHSVWVMNADGTDAHQIVTADDAPLGATHVQAIAWSSAGDRIGLLIDQGIYTFAPDGSDIAKSGRGLEFCWPGQQC